MANLAQYMTSGNIGAAESTVGRIAPLPDITAPEEEATPISPPDSGRGASEIQVTPNDINHEALGAELATMGAKNGVPLDQDVEEGKTTYAKIGEKFAGLNPDHSLVAKHKYRSWESDFREFAEDLPKIPGLKDVAFGVPASENIAGSPGVLGHVEPFGRGIRSGLTLGGTELLHQELFPGTYQPPDDLLYDVGNFLGSLAPYAVSYRGIKHLKQLQEFLIKHPKMRHYLEEMLVGGTLEGFRGLIDPEEEVVSGTGQGALGGLVGTGIVKGGKAGYDLLAGSFVRPGAGTGSLAERYPWAGSKMTDIVEFFGNAKQGIDTEFQKIMDNYGIPFAPALLRPRDPGTRMATKKVVRASAAIPDLDVQSRQMDAALDRIEDDIIAGLAPQSMEKAQIQFTRSGISGTPISPPTRGRGAREAGIKGAYNQVKLPTNTDTGLIIRNSVRKTIDKHHDEADQLYNKVLVLMEEAPIKTENIVKRLDAMLKKEGYDQQTNIAQVNQVREVIRHLQKLRKKTDVMSDEDLAQMQSVGQEASPWLPGPIKQEQLEATAKEINAKQDGYADVKYGWLYNQYKTLKVARNAPYDPGDTVKFQARDIIRDELSSAASGFSDEAASIMLKANTSWSTYKKLRWPRLHTDEHTLAKQLYESDGSKVVETIFKSVPNIREARTLLGQEGFDLARIRYLKSILWNRQPTGTMPNPDDLAGGLESTHDLKPSIDISNFNKVVKNAGGDEGEIWLEMFAGEPDKYSAFLQLNRIVNRVAPIRQAYAGVAEEAGGGEQGGVVGLLGSLLSRSSMLLHFAGTKGIGKALTRPEGENVFLGAAWRSKYTPAVGRGQIPEVANKAGQPPQFPAPTEGMARRGAQVRQTARDVTGRDITSRALPTQAAARILGVAPIPYIND